MNVCLLTYDAPHLKTQQVFYGLLGRGFRKIDFLLMPFTYRPERKVLFQHRPHQFVGQRPQELAVRGGGTVHEYASWPNRLNDYDVFLVCGSNLIEADFAYTRKVLNVHAGLIPSVRGLDAFKWAILDGRPLGNTLHRIDAETDSGEVLAHRETEILREDTLRSLADRHYRNEIWMLTNFDRLPKTICPYPKLAPKMRMPRTTEAGMLGAFEAYKKRAVRTVS